jgi:hypothetical protein
MAARDMLMVEPNVGMKVPAVADELFPNGYAFAWMVEVGSLFLGKFKNNFFYCYTLIDYPKCFLTWG